MSATQIDGRQIKNLGGDASGTGDALVVTGLQGVPVSATSPTTSYVLTFNGTDWAPAPGGGGGGVGGSGTAGMVPLWSAGTTLGDSLISQLSGAVGINRVTGTAVDGPYGLEVTGGIASIGDGVAGTQSGINIIGYNGSSPAVGFKQANGPESAPTNTVSGDLIGFVGSKGFDGTSISPGSRVAISFNAAEDFTPTAQGTSMVFRVTATGTVANTNVLHLMASTTSAGRMGVNVASPAATVDILGNIKIADGTQSSGYVLTSDGAGIAHWAAPSGGGGSPAGSTGNVQFNGAGSFAADSTFNWDATNGALVVGGFPAPLPGPIPAIVGVADGGPFVIMSAMYSASGDSPLFIGVRAGGSEASPAASPSGGGLVTVSATGHDGTSFDFNHSGGEIRMSANELWSGSAHGTDLTVVLCASGSTSHLGVLYATASGGGRLAVGLGSGVTPDTTLHIGGSIKIVDGNQGLGKILTSDANGVGSWQDGGSLPTPTTPGDVLTVVAVPGQSISGASPATTTAGGNFNIQVNGADYAQFPIAVNNFEGSGANFQMSVDDGTNAWFIDANNTEGIIQISNAGTYLGGFANPLPGNGIMVPDGAGNVWIGSFNSQQIAKVGPGGSFAYSAADSATGIAFDGTLMWVAGSNSTLSAYDLTGAQTMTLDISPFFGNFSGYPTAIAFDGTDLWVNGVTGNSDETTFVQFDLTGTMLNQYTTTSFGYAFQYYLIFAMGSLWAPAGDGNGLMNVSLGGTFTRFAGGYAGSGLTFDGTGFWYTDSGIIYHTDGTGVTIEKFQYPTSPSITTVVGFSGGMFFYESNVGDFRNTVINAPLAIGSAGDGPTIASEIQAAVNAVTPNTLTNNSNLNAYSNFIVIFNGRYDLASGNPGPGSSVVVTSAVSGDVAAALKLGVANGGAESVGLLSWAERAPSEPTSVGGVTISTSGQSSGYVLVSDGSGGTSWVPQSNLFTGANGSSNGLVQFGEGGLFATDNNFFWDNSSHFLGIGVGQSPQYEVDVNGSINFTNQFLFNGSQPFSTDILADGFNLVNFSTSASGDINGNFGSSFFVTGLNGAQIIGSSPSIGGMVLMSTVANPNQVEWTSLTSVPSWQKVTVAYTDLSAAGVFTNTFSFTSLPAGAIVHGVKIKHSTSFTGGAITSYKVSIGDGTTADAYASAFNVFQGTGSSTYQLTNLFVGVDQSTGPNMHITATSTGDTLDHATQGSVDVWVLVSVAV